MKTKSIKKNAIMNTILTMSSFVFQFISFPYISRVLNPIGVGKSTFAISLVAYFAIFSQLGIPTYGVVICAKYRDNKRKLSESVKELLIINLFMTIVTYSIFILVISIVPKLATDKKLYMIASATIILNAIGMEWLYRGLEQYTYITYRSIIFKFIALALMLICVNTSQDYIIYTAITVLATSGSQVCNLLYAKKYVDFNIHIKECNFKQHYKPIITFFMMSCATTIYTHLDAVMLGIMKTDEIVGYYNAATKIKSFLISFVTTIGTVLLPRASFYINNNQYNKFIEISSKALKFVFLFGTSVSVYFLLFSNETILILSGSQYRQSVLPMEILMPTVLFIGLTNVIGIQMLVPLGKEQLVLISEIGGALSNLIINIVLIPKYGAVGASIGTLCAEGVVLLFQTYFIKKYISIQFEKKIFIEFGFIIVIASILSKIVVKLRLTTILTLIISAIVFFLLVFIWTYKKGIVREFLKNENTR